MSDIIKGDLIKAAKYLCVATNQIGVAFNTNEYGTEPRVTLVESWNQQLFEDWRDRSFAKWLLCKDLNFGVVICGPFVDGVFVNASEDEIMVEFVRILCPDADDCEEYSRRHGCATIDEAEEKFGDLSWIYNRKYVTLKGHEVREFLYHVVPYCWDDPVYYRDYD